ncbi:MAG TPA: phosphate/phosphite/phosphonate ABC transporter substrate-binding protein [Arenimonas sp.]|uniref:phosphate/phosphite/phosphonate ABC transporter substrate-binding protein n=1 Tax=Arenimonas sp. TaxID=1872635 RepID=UPI002D80DB11|nr:phosphate/phosphite/phosphonate ABC transporter substrate-binding protein [Arenimonas sp.]HEU0154093.1 phosphate/phosphite/phosphonate ABC transporter substrate-binding protein [Arenimonas sp.]
MTPQQPRPKPGLRRLFLLLLLLLAGPAPAADGVLVLGRISDDPRRHHEQLKPLLDYVVPRMRTVGITQGRVLMARDPQQMMSYLRRGKVDWVTETPGTGLLLADRVGARPLLLTERSGAREYRSVIFVRRDSGITDLDQLLGKTIAFQSPSSTSAYLVPAMALRRRRLPMGLMVSPLEGREPGSVGYVFANTDANLAAWVHKRLVDAGGFSDQDWDQLQRVSEAFRRDLVVIHTTEPVPRAMELVSANMAPDVEARLKEVLLGASTDPQARDALRQFFRTTGFYEPDAAAQVQLQQLRRGAREIREALE